MNAPGNSHDFSIAIFCALPLEAESVLALFDSTWDNSDYPIHERDPNAYTLGTVGPHHVVLVHMPSTGTISAAGSAAHLQRTFPGIRLALVVGICGGVPNGPNQNIEIILGDVIISSTIVQYDLGREYPDGFEVKRQVDDSHGRAHPSIRTLINRLKAAQHGQRLEARTREFLRDVQQHIPSSKDPGMSFDQLFDPSYLHRHRRRTRESFCQECESTGKICRLAVESSCEALGCEKSHLVERRRHQNSLSEGSPASSRPSVFFLPMASGNKVLKSAERRDHIARELGVGAFEMEGAGVWEQLPTIVVKAVSDYADCHKNKSFQTYAAACAAACTKALLMEQPAMIVTSAYNTPPSLNPSYNSKEPKSSASTIWSVPFSGLDNYIGRALELEMLEQKLFEPQGSKRAAVVRPAGIGKTRLALEIANLARSKASPLSVFWVHAADVSTLEQDFLAIGKCLQIPGIDVDKTNIKSLVHEGLRQTSAGAWLLIFDNADNETLWGRRGSLIDWVPRYDRGSILVTTRTSRVAAQLVGHQYLVELSKLSEADSLALFQQQHIADDDGNHETSVSHLLERLDHYPLAIVQAAAYMRVNGNTPAEYLEILNMETEEGVAGLLDEEFGVNDRYPKVVNSILTTWTVSFDQIQRQNQLAAEYLSFLCCLNNSKIPKAALKPGKSPKQTNDAIGTLKAYYLISEKNGYFDMHNLVYLATRNWLRVNGRFADHIQEVVVRMLEVIPLTRFENRDAWFGYLPHLQALFASRPSEDPSGCVHNLSAKYGVMLVHCGKPKEGVIQLKAVVQWYEQQYGINDQRTWYVYFQLGQAYIELGDTNTAQSYLEIVYQRYRENLGEESSDTAWCMLRLSEVYRLQESYEEAERMISKVVKIWKRVHGENHITTMNALRNMGYIYLRQSRYSEAQPILEHVWNATSTSPLSSPMDKMKILNDLSVAYDEQGRHDEAEVIGVQVLEQANEILGEEHPFTLMQMENVATIYLGQKRYIEAEALITRAIIITEREQGPDSGNLETARALLDQIKKAVASDTEEERKTMETYEVLSIERLKM